ncbi:MAG: cytochrome c oxidase subunit II [Candidatus Krumholzibacteriia bacterium]
MGARTSFLPYSAALLLGGCAAERPQSILDPAGPIAEHITGLWWEMFAVYGAVFLVTLLLVVLALAARKRERTVLGTRFVFIAGIVVPTVILVFMLYRELDVHRSITRHTHDFHVQVIGHGWWFEVRYPDHGLVDANEIHVPAGTTVLFELSAESMLHSFWVPRLGGKRDQLPDHPGELRLDVTRAGVYHGVCTEYCAGQHARMGFRLVAHEPDEFDIWLARRSAAPPEPDDPWLQRGRDVFQGGGCASCHAIRGISEADTGPDLTHVGSRRTLGAGSLENSRGVLAGWIADPQSLKPRVRMDFILINPEPIQIRQSAHSRINLTINSIFILTII